MNYNKSQQQAIRHKDGPMLVLAGPGSGKTAVITQRTKQLIEYENIDPSNILVITFTRAAAQEMKQRFLAATGEERTKVTFGTFHAIFFMVLKLAYHFDSGNIISEEQRYQFMREILSYHHLEYRDEGEFIGDVLTEISRVKNEQIPLEHFYSSSCGEEVFRKIYREYDERLKRNRLIDFDDMLTYTYELFSQRKDILSAWQKKYRYILIDEFQDINLIQWKIMCMLAAPENNLFVVGDDDQSIYGFRGSRPEFMRGFLQQYTDVKRYELTANYRSGERIVALGRKIIEQNKERFPKEFLPKKKGGEVSFQHLNTRREEEELLVQDIRRNSMECLDQTAIIVRTNLEARQYEALLKGKQFPVAGSIKKEQGVFQSEVAEDLYAFLRFLYEGGHRKDFMRIMDKLEPDLTRKALVSEIISEEELMRYYRNNVEMRGQIRKLFSKLALAGRLQTHLAIRLFLNEIGYDSYLKKKSRSYVEYEDKKKMAQTIQEVFASYQRTKPLDEFILQCQEKENKSPIAEQRKGIHVMTMHASKGLEFQHVYLPDLNEGIIPPKGVVDAKQIEEERRLLYVAVTRAREKLFLYETRERNRKVTRFLVL